jgi:hypothetical protein
MASRRPNVNGADGSEWPPDDQNSGGPAPLPATNPHDLARQRDLAEVARSVLGEASRA